MRLPNRTVSLLEPGALAAPLPPAEYLIPALGIATGAPVCFAGYGFSGKTISLQSAALSVASGRPLWGLYTVKRGRVLHLDFEQGRRLTIERYQRLAGGMGIDLGELDDSLRVGVNPEVYLDDQDAFDVYSRLFEDFAFVIVDSLRAAAPRVRENDSEVRNSIDLLNRAAERHGAVVAFIHHARKPSDDNRGAARYAIRGSSAIYDACGSVFVMSAEKDAPIRVEHEKCRNRGIPVETFGLQIIPSKHPDGPETGLKIVHMNAEQFRAPASPGAAQAKRAQAIEAFLKQNGGRFAGSKNALLERLGGNRQSVLAALSTLQGAGRVRVDEKAHTISLVPVPCGTGTSAELEPGRFSGSAALEDGTEELPSSIPPVEIISESPIPAAPAIASEFVIHPNVPAVPAGEPHA